MPSLALDGTLPGGGIRVRKRLILSGSVNWIRGVGLNSARLLVTKRTITLSISANGIRCEDLPKPHPSLFLLPSDLLRGGVSKVPGFVRLGVEAFLDFGIADALFFHTGG